VSLRPCLDCGTPTGATRCLQCSGPFEARRQARQPYRAAYGSAKYREARRIRIIMAGEQCEFYDGFGQRCHRPAVETHHMIPLSSARSLEEALELCSVTNLRAVCFGHNPRGQKARAS
jgi:hypothetical protein